MPKNPGLLSYTYMTVLTPTGALCPYFPVGRIEDIFTHPNKVKPYGKLRRLSKGKCWGVFFCIFFRLRSLTLKFFGCTHFDCVKCSQRQQLSYLFDLLSIWRNDSNIFWFQSSWNYVSNHGQNFHQFDWIIPWKWSFNSLFLFKGFKFALKVLDYFLMRGFRGAEFNKPWFLSICHIFHQNRNIFIWQKWLISWNVKSTRWCPRYQFAIIK